MYQTNNNKNTMSEHNTILSIDEATSQGLPILNKKNHKNSSEKNVALCCDLISPAFKEFLVATSVAELEEHIERVKSRPLKESKIVWVNILRNLTKYSADELVILYETKNQEWRDFCNDVALWYCYNAVIFKKGIPVCDLTDEMKAKIH
jgi:hypothetical protein